MTRNSRELSQFASFVEVRDASRKVGINTTFVVDGGVGIGQTVGDYNSEIVTRGVSDALIVNKDSFFLQDVVIDGDINLTGTSSSVRTTDLLVTGISTLASNTGLGTVFIGKNNASLNGEISTALVVVDVDPTNNFALDVAGSSSFDTINYGTRISGPDGQITTFRSENISVTSIAASTIGVSGAVTSSTAIIYSENPGRPDFIGTGSLPYALDVVGSVYAGTHINAGQNINAAHVVSIGHSLENGNTIPGTSDVVSSEIWSDLNIYSNNFTIGVDTGQPNYQVGFETTKITLSNAKFDSNILPYSPDLSIGTFSSRWVDGHFSDLGIHTSLNVYGQLNAFSTSRLDETIVNVNASDFALSVTSGISTFKEVEINPSLLVTGKFGVIGLATFTPLNEGDISVEGYITTARRAERIDIEELNSANSDSPNDFNFPVFTPTGIAQTGLDAGQLFVNQGFYIDTFTTSLYIANQLNILGDAINANTALAGYSFDLLNSNVSSLNAFGEADFITFGATGNSASITTVRSSTLEVGKLFLRDEAIIASTGTTHITIVDDGIDINTLFAGRITIGGTSITSSQSDVYVFTDAAERIRFGTNALFIDMGIQSNGITTIRNLKTDIQGQLRLGENQIRNANDSEVILFNNTNTDTEFIGNIQVGGNKILTSAGSTNITLSENSTEFFGDIIVGSDQIKASDGELNIRLESNDLTTFSGAIIIEGDQIRAGTGDTNITLNGNNWTKFVGAIQIDGDEIRSSNGSTNIVLDGDFLTEFKGDIRVGGAGSIQAADGVTCITLTPGIGDVGIASDLTANSVFFNGLEARLNVKDLNIRDKLINISLIEDPTNTGNLIPPNIGLGNTGDSGLVFARWDVGINTHKYGAIYWDDSTQRVSIATDVTETDPTIYAGDRYLLRNGDPAELEVSNLYVTNSTTGIKTIFETNQTDNTILNIVNVEIDAGTF